MLKTSSLAALVAASLALQTSPAAAQAAGSGFSLGDFDQFGLLINNGVSGGDINTAPVNANIGVGDIGSSINLHNEVVNGVVDVANGVSTVSGGNITGTVPAGQGGGTAAVVASPALVQSAITAASNLSSTYGAEAAQGTAVTLNGNATLNANNGFLDSSGTRVFTASSLSIGNGHALTINGTANQYVVVDVTGGQGNKLDGAVTLTGGITADHVLLNFIGSGGNLQGAANGAAISATVLAPNLGIQLNSLALDGRLFGGASGTNFQFVSNALINQPPETPQGSSSSSSSSSSGGSTSSTSSGGTVVPEPPMLALFALALGLPLLRRRLGPVSRAI